MAESLINPFGLDADDFDIADMIERNMQVCLYLNYILRRKNSVYGSRKFLFANGMQLNSTKLRTNDKF